MSATLPSGVKKLLEQPNFAHIATLMADGSPQVSPVWVALDGDRIIVNTAEGRTKPRNMRRDGRVALSIVDQANPYSHALVRGRVIKATHEGADASIDSLAKKYLGQDRYPFRQAGERRVIFVIEAEHIVSNVSE